MKSWKEIRKDRRLKTELISYNANEPGRFSFIGSFTFENGKEFHVIAGSDEDGWEHVSVDFPWRAPTWDEMCVIKDVFWKDEEECIQIHPKKSQYVNIAENCLHIWRKKDGMALPGR